MCSARNVDLVRSLGADLVVDYTSEDVTRSPERYDLVLQVAGAHTASALRRVLTRRGVLVMISGDSEGRWVGPVGRMVGARLTSPFVGQTLTSFTVTPNAEDLDEVGRLVEAGAVTPVIDRTYTFGDVADALLYLETGAPAARWSSLPSRERDQPGRGDQTSATRSSISATAFGSVIIRSWPVSMSQSRPSARAFAISSASRGASVDVQTMWYCGIAATAASSARCSGCSKHFHGMRREPRRPSTRCRRGR